MTIQRETLQPFATKKGGYIEEKKKETKPYNRDGAPSPIFAFVNTQMTTGKYNLIDLYEDTPATRKYGIFTNLRVTNTSAENIILYPNQNKSHGIFIANNTSVELKIGDLGGGYTSFLLYNAGSGTISASELRFECFKEGATIDTATKEASLLIHKAMRLIRGF